VTAEDRRAIHVDQFLPHPPSRVWTALTDPDLLARWLMPNDFKPAVGHRFTMTATPNPRTNFSGTVSCEVLELRPEELLSISWADAARSNPMSTVVTWTLRPEGRGTRLFLEHRGFDPDDPVQQLARTILGGGWRGMVLRAIRAVLADQYT
jgi:uncharacterized protein YndB with AHSA1/START domain